jgi:hypothetical protein
VWPNPGQGPLILKVSRSHTTHHTRQDSSGRMISSSQRCLTTHYTQKRQKLRSRWQSNPKSRQTSGRSPKPGRIAPGNLNLSTRWMRVVKLTSRPLYHHCKSSCYFLDRTLRRHLSRSGRVRIQSNYFFKT